MENLNVKMHGFLLPSVSRGFSWRDNTDSVAINYLIQARCVVFSLALGKRMSAVRNAAPKGASLLYAQEPTAFAKAVYKRVRMPGGEGSEDCAILRAGSASAATLGTRSVFMLTHGKEVRRVSFLMEAMKALPSAGLRWIVKVSFGLGVVIT